MATSWTGTSTRAGPKALERSRVHESTTHGRPVQSRAHDSPSKPSKHEGRSRRPVQGSRNWTES